MFDIIGDRICNSLLLFLTNTYLQERNQEMLSCINLLVDLIIQKKERSSERMEEYWCKIFYKCIRLMSITMLFKETQDLHSKLAAICKHVWDKHRKGKPVMTRQWFSAEAERCSE